MHVCRITSSIVQGTSHEFCDSSGKRILLNLLINAAGNLIVCLITTLSRNEVCQQCEEDEGTKKVLNQLLSWTQN